MGLSDSESDDIAFDPAHIEDFVLDCEAHFDCAKPGRYDDRAKLGYVLKIAKIDKGLSDTLRDWKRRGELCL